MKAVRNVQEFLHGFANALIAIGILLTIVWFLIGSASADDSINFSFADVDDGSCESPLETLALGYRHEPLK